MAAGLDDEAVMASFGERLAESRQRRRAKIHRDSVHEQQREIGLALARRKEQAMQSFFIAGFGIQELRFHAHSGFSAVVYVLMRRIKPIGSVFSLNPPPNSQGISMIPGEFTGI